MVQASPELDQHNREVINNAADLTRLVRETGLESLASVHTLTVRAATLYGQAYLHKQKAERYKTLEIQADCAAFEEERADLLEEAGSRIIDTAIGEVESVTRELSELESGEAGNGEEVAQQFQTQFKHGLATLQIKPDDAAEIMEIVTEATETGLTRSPEQISGYVEEAVTGLHDTQCQIDMGREGNLSGWCKAALIGVIGIAAIAVVAACAMSGGIACGAAIGLASGGVATAGRLLDKYC
ncbi:MAG: hypothetical protein ABEH58_04155 [Haloplanus sp.]